MVSRIRTLHMRSKLDVISNAEDIQDEVVALVIDDFGIRNDLDVKIKYSYGDLNTEDKIRNRAMVLEHAKARVESWSGNAVGSLRGANSIFHKTNRDLEQRRSYQNQAIAEYTKSISELERILSIFSDTDTKRIESLISKIRNEISMIKKWRRSDEKR